MKESKYKKTNFINFMLSEYDVNCNGFRMNKRMYIEACENLYDILRGKTNYRSRPFKNVMEHRFICKLFSHVLYVNDRLTKIFVSITQNQNVVKDIHSCIDEIHRRYSVLDKYDDDMFYLMRYNGYDMYDIIDDILPRFNVPV